MWQYPTLHVYTIHGPRLSLSIFDWKVYFQDIKRSWMQITHSWYIKQCTLAWLSSAQAMSIYSWFAGVMPTVLHENVAAWNFHRWFLLHLVFMFWGSTHSRNHATFFALKIDKTVGNLCRRSKVVAGRSSVSLHMASVFLSNNISLFTNFAQVGDVIATSHSKWPMKKYYIMYVNYMPILIFGSLLFFGGRGGVIIWCL